MGNKTPLARVLFGRCQKLVGLLVLGVFLFIAVLTGVKPQTANAAAPTNLNFQARLQTSAGSIVPDGSYNIEFKLYNASSSTGSSQGSCSGDANCLWTETRTGANTVTVKNGYLTVNLGSVNAFSGIDWSQQLWLTMRVGGTGTPSWDPEMSPRILLTATPYAMYAANAATLGGIGSSGFIQNTTTPQSANAYITAATSGSVAATLQANAAGTGSILSMRDGSGNLVANFDAFGNLFSQQIVSNDTITANTYGTSHNALLVTQSSASATAPVLLVKGGATPGSGSDLLQLQNSSSQALAGFSNAGQLYLGRSSGATGSLKLFNSTNANTVTLQSGVTTGSYTLTLPTALGASGNCLVDTNGSGALGFASCASSGGVTAVGAIAGTSNANGATITGSTLNLTPADGTNGGVVTNTTQTFAGDKTFNSNVGIGGAPSSTKLDITAGTTRGLRITSTNETPYAIAINNATYGTGDGNAFAFYQGDNGVGHVGVGANYQALNIASNGNVGFGAGAANPSRQLVSAISDTQTVAPGTLFQQSGTGDSSIELKNANTSWYTGIDTSNGNSFNINSYGAAAASTTATLGQDYSVQSPTGSDLNPTSIQATKFVAGASGTLSSISMAFRAAVNGSSQYAVGIFADSSGSPGAILGKHTGASVISTPVVGGVNWNTQTLDSPVTITSGTTYWLAVETNDGSSFNTRGAGSGNSAYRTAGVTAGTWGSTFSTTGTGSTSTSTEQIGIYGTITVPGTLSDTYANSVLNITTSGAATFRNSANSTTAFRIQNAASNNILAVDTTGGTVTLGTASSLNASLVFANSSNANSVTLQSGVTSASYSITLPTAAGTTGQCLAAGTVSGGNVPLTFSACGSSGGVTSVGAISSTSNANGATVTGSVLNLTAADQTNGGALTSGNQNIGGTKTFYGGAVINGGQNFSLSAGTGTLTQTYNGTAAGTAQTITMANTSGTNTSAQQIDRNGAGGTTTNGLYVTSTAGTLTNGINIANVSGTLTNGITLSGTMTNLINATNFTVTNAGAITAGSTYNTNTFTGTQLTFGGASGTVTGTNLSLKAAGTGTLTLDSASAGGTVTVGSLATTVNLGLSAGSTINVGTATSGSNTVNVANSATATNALSIGSSNTASTTTITGAGNNIVLSNIAGVAISGATSITGSLGVSGSISTGGTQRISNTGALTNVTADTSILTSGTLGIARGGTNNTTYTTNGVIYYDGTKMTSTAAGTSGQCLKSNGTSAAPTYGACGTGSASTLQNAYDASVTASANPMIQLSTAGISVRDAASTVGSLMTFQNSAGTVTYFGLTNNALNLQDTSGNASITLDSANHQLKIYENGGTYSRYANVYYDSTNGEAVFTASSGTTRVGSGSGNILLQLTNSADVLQASKTVALSSAYSSNDFTFTRSITAGANSLTGSVVKIESTSSGSGTLASNLLWINENNLSATGNLILATKNGAGNVKFQVDSAGSITTAGGISVASGQTISSASGALSIAAGSGNLTLTAGSGSVLILGSAGNTVRLPGLTNCATLKTDSSGNVACGSSSLSTRSFLSSTSVGVADNNTTNYWTPAVENNSSYPNITPSSTSKQVYGVVTMETTSTGTADVEVTARVERGIGSAPSCNAGTAIGGNAGTFSSNTSAQKTSTTTFLDTPSTTSAVYYVVCADTATVGKTANITRLRFTLFEVDNSNADYAEIYSSNDVTLQPGEVVSLDSSLKNGVRRSSGADGQTLVGVVSSQPAQVIGGKEPEAATGVAIGLNGRLPVRVSTENGPIKPGDLLTASHIPGVAMKATEAGMVLGTAMEAYDAPVVGQIMTFVHTDSYGGSNTNLIKSVEDLQSQISFLKQKYELMGTSIEVSGLTASKLTVNGGAVITGMLEVGDLRLNGHFVTAGQTPAVAAMQVLSGVGSDGRPAGTVSIDGNDTSGTVTVHADVAPNAPGQLLKVTFNRPFSGTPRIMVTPYGKDGAMLPVYVDSADSRSFILSTVGQLTAGTAYSYTYFVVQ